MAVPLLWISLSLWFYSTTISRLELVCTSFWRGPDSFTLLLLSTWGQCKFSQWHRPQLSSTQTDHVCYRRQKQSQAAATVISNITQLFCQLLNVSFFSQYDLTWIRTGSEVRWQMTDTSHLHFDVCMSASLVAEANMVLFIYFKIQINNTKHRTIVRHYLFWMYWNSQST